jgi:muramoyltetrapeptide carboxypeptidase
VSDAPAPTCRWPRPLAPGDVVAGVAPAGPADPALVRRGIALLESWGLTVRLGRAAFAGHATGFLAADDAARAGDLHEAVADPAAAALVALRGGWGCQRLLGRLDWDAVAAAAKPLVGFSDVTALHVAWRQRAGLVSFHGPSLAWRDERLGGGEATSLRAALFGEPDACVTGRPVRGGRATGVLVGGNLTVLASLCGTPWQLDATGAVVLVEDVGERPYRLDRALTQLRQAGALSGAVGLAVGELVDCDAPQTSPPSASALEVVASHAEELGLAAAELPLGHGRGQRTVPLGAVVTVDGEAGRLRVHAG